MSLETVLAENTAALAKLSALITSLLERPPIPDGPSATPAPAERPQADTKPEKSTPAPRGEAAPAAATKPTAEAAKVAAPETKAEPSAPTLSYDVDVAPAILGLAKAKGRAAATTLLQQFKAAKGTDLKPKQYAAFVTQAKELAS